MVLRQMMMEDWFIKTKDARLNFSESGVPDFNLNDFFKKIGADKSLLGRVYLGNNSTWGSSEFRRAVSGVYKSVKEKDLIITNGTSEALYIFFNLILGQKSKVLILHPAFPLLYLLPQALKSKVYFFDVLSFKEKKELLENLKAQINKIRPDWLIINTPHNPTGFCFNEQEIDDIGRSAKKFKIKILLDEHYRFLPIGQSGGYLPSAYDVISRFYDKVFAVGSVIKCSGTVGIRVGWLIADKLTLGRVRDYKDYTTHCVPAINETITRLAIENIHKITPFFLGRIKNNWDLLKDDELVKKERVILNYELEGGCVYFPAIKGMKSLELSKTLFRKHSISVLPGEIFNKGGHIRINMAQSADDFKYLLRCLRQAMPKRILRN